MVLRLLFDLFPEPLGGHGLVVPAALHFRLVADAAQLRMLRGYVFRLLGRMVDDIASGYVNPNPYTRGSAHSACAWCPYGAICAGEREQGRRNYKAMTAQRFWDEIEREASRRGK